MVKTLDRHVMPRLCVFCGTECGDSEMYCCDGCAADLPWNIRACPRCAEPLAAARSDGVACGSCQQQAPPVVAAAAPLTYAFPVDAAIKALKFRRRLDYIPAFAPMLAAMLPALPPDIDTLLPVPLHWRRQAKRGFNQAAELCKSLARIASLPVVTNVVRCRATPYQSGLGAGARRRNLKAAFSVQGGIVAGHVLIVDDVITTGATSRQLARTILAAGAGRVSVLAIAKAAGDQAGVNA